MTNIVAKAGVVFPPANVLRSVTIPDLNGLFAEFWLGVDGPTSKKNRAYGGSDLIDLAGQLPPTYASNYATVKSQGASTSMGLDSAFVAPANVTILALQRQQVAVNGLKAGRVFGSDKTMIGGNSAAGAATYSFLNGWWDGSTDQAHVDYSAALDGNFHFVAGVGQIGQPGTVYAYTNGVAATDVATRTDATRDAGTFKLGGFVVAGVTGQVDVAWVAAFNVLKTPAQIDALYASVKAWGQSRGLTVS